MTVFSAPEQMACLPGVFPPSAQRPRPPKKSPGCRMRAESGWHWVQIGVRSKQQRMLTSDSTVKLRRGGRRYDLALDEQVDHRRIGVTCESR